MALFNMLSSSVVTVLLFCVAGAAVWARVNRVQNVMAVR